MYAPSSGAGRFGHAAGGIREVAGERTEAPCQAAEEVDQAPEHFQQRARPRQAASETDGAQAPAAAVPQQRLAAARSKHLFAQQGFGGARGKKPLEDGAGFLQPFAAIDPSADHFIGNARREFHGGELIGEVRFERSGELLHQDGEVSALISRRRYTYRRPQRLTDALPVAVEIVREGAEVTRTAADQPPEDDAAADVLDTPAPLLHRTQDFPGFGREHAEWQPLR